MPRRFAPGPWTAADETANGAARTALVALALAIAALGIHGNLVPPSFQPMPYGEAMGRFRELLAPETFGWTDRYHWMVSISAPRGCGVSLDGGTAGAAALSVWVGLVGMGVVLEFVQVQLPGRTVALDDVVARGIGAAVGIGLWTARGARRTMPLHRLAARRWRRSASGTRKRARP